MAVYTEVGFEQAEAFVRRLGHGRVSALQGIGAGIENTNYFVSTDRGEWVLTLFERLSSEQLPFYLRYMQHLAQHGMPVPEPQTDASGQILHQLCGRPAALVNRLPGRHVLAPELPHLQQMGEMLARHAPGRRGFRAAAAQPARAGLVDRDGAGGACLSWTSHARNCCARSWSSSAAWPRRARPRRCRTA